MYHEKKPPEEHGLRADDAADLNLPGDFLRTPRYVRRYTNFQTEKLFF
jgi:hypothetical protein